MSRKIRVVVADDSAFIRGLIVSYLESAGDFEVAGTAENGEHAVELVEKLHPDVVTLDVEMPRLSGLQALDAIMRDTPTPVVMVSGCSSRAADTTLRAINAGAVDFVLKYIPGARISPEEIRLDVISKVRAASSVRVVRTIASRIGQEQPSLSSRSARLGSSNTAGQNSAARVGDRQNNSPSIPDDLVVIGASTGGPIAIKELLGCLPVDFAAPIVIVQHISPHFTDVLAAQLNCQSSFHASVVRGGETFEPRNIYIADGDHHLLLSGSVTLELHDGPAICGHRPSIDVTMKSLAQGFPNRIHGVLLTGMGFDGASGLAYIRARGGTTYAQDAQTSVVFGMPKCAIQANAVDHVATPQGIAEHLAIQIAKSAALGRAEQAVRNASNETVRREGRPGLTDGRLTDPSTGVTFR